MRLLPVSGSGGRTAWTHRIMRPLLALLGGGILLAGTAAGLPAGAAGSTGPAPGYRMSAAAESASTVYLAFTGTDQAVYVMNAAQPTRPTMALGGQLIGGPALAVVPAGVLSTGPALAVFGRGADNALWWRHQTASGWTGWQSLGGALTAGPAATVGMSIQFGVLNVFARGTDGTIWYRVFGSGAWAPWTALGGAVLTGTGPGGGDSLFAIAASSQHVVVFGRTGMANGYLDFGGRTASTPDITVAAHGQAPVFARGLDNALWYRVSALPIGAAGPWTSLGGRLTSGVTATTVPSGKTYVFVLGTDHNIWMRTGTWPSLGGWTRL